jgi:hypothetical protein
VHLNKEELDGVRLLRAELPIAGCRNALPDPILRGPRRKIGWAWRR